VYAESTRLWPSEPGTLYYCISRDPDDGAVFHFFERYAGRAAFRAHVQQPLMQKLFADGLIKDVKAKFAAPIVAAAAP
jgi:quinol monooxygenase YgiN